MTEKLDLEAKRVLWPVSDFRFLPICHSVVCFRSPVQDMRETIGIGLNEMPVRLITRSIPTTG
jgi:hypothetical protein